MHVVSKFAERLPGDRVVSFVEIRARLQVIDCGASKEFASLWQKRAVHPFRCSRETLDDVSCGGRPGGSLPKSFGVEIGLIFGECRDGMREPEFIRIEQMIAQHGKLILQRR